MYVWSMDQALRLVQREPKENEPHPALACFGAVRKDIQAMYLYFSDGQLNSEQVWVFIMGLLAVARAGAKRVVVMIWDQAGWHLSKRLCQWMRAYNHQAKQCGEPRLLTYLLPVKSLWLNPIEPRWMHAKRGVCEPDGDLLSLELIRRLCAHFDTQPFFQYFQLMGSEPALRAA